MELFENWDGFRVALFHVTDDHVPADQLIESKHTNPFQGKVDTAPHFPN
jgi:hypothetical protein